MVDLNLSRGREEWGSHLVGRGSRRDDGLDEGLELLLVAEDQRQRKVRRDVDKLHTQRLPCAKRRHSSDQHRPTKTVLIEAR